MSGYPLTWEGDIAEANDAAALEEATLFDLTEGERRAEEGAALALTADDDALDAWRTAAQAAMDLLIRSGWTFTADEITARAGEPPSPNAMGGLFRANRSSIKAVGYTKTTRAAGHARVIRVWAAK